MEEIKNDINYLIPHSKSNNAELDGVYCIEYQYLTYKSDEYLNEYLRFVKSKYKLLVLLFWEEFIYDAETIKIIDICIEIKLPLFISSKNPTLDEFLKLKYPLEHIWSSNISMQFCREEFVNNDSLTNQFYINNKSIKLLFLNYNRKPNRDYIITKLKDTNLLYDESNYVSFHNYYTTPDKKYNEFDMQYINQNNIDIKFLNNFKLVPEETDVHNQLATQIRSYQLYSMSKFNIICEPFFGYYNDTNSYDYYNHIITNKTILPLLYKNVFFIHEYNNLFSESLIKIGFKPFFDNIDDFLNNMTDEYLSLESTIEKLNHNQQLTIKLLKLGKFEFFNKIKTLLNEL
jgi:hypothetical protein